MERLDAISGLIQELRNEAAVVDLVLLLHRAFDRDTLLIHNDDSEYTHVGVDPIEGFFHFLR